MSKTVIENKKLWWALERTDPKQTKAVGFGRKFTSINAQWQIMRVTEVLGPVGLGWGYDVEHSTKTIHDRLMICFADVRLWWTNDDSKGKNTYGPVRGCTELYYQATTRGALQWDDVDKTVPKMVLDDDAPKKAMTDALTKGLSHIGMSADVFLGLYDDNKYVTRMTREFTAEQAGQEKLPADVAVALADVADASDLDRLNLLADVVRTLAVGWQPVHRDLYAIRLRERRLQLGGTVPAEMRIVRIDPAKREITVVEGDIDEMISREIGEPKGMVDIDPGYSVVCCTIGSIGGSADLWWHEELGDVFGGIALVIGFDRSGNLVPPSEGAWWRTRKAVEFLGTGDEALPRLRQLIGGCMSENAPDERQGILPLTEPKDDLH